jgi:ParB family transcriptional regulator, chromosome partitioning protein
MKKQSTNDTPKNEAIITAIPHSKLKVSDLNPRKQKRDEKDLLELAESIAAKGVLHNLTARPKGAGYEIAIGEGRFLAVAYLIKEKRLPKDYPMPVCVKELSDLDMLELATSENIQRSDMHPADEAQAFNDMMKLGSDVDSIALKMGMSSKTVAQRLAVATKLTDKVKQALLEDNISLAQAQQLTAASFETQDDVLHLIVTDTWGDSWSADDIKQYLKETQMLQSNAIFKKDKYQGELSNNLFDDSQKTFFVDSEQAKRLQLGAIEQRREKLSKVWSWVEVLTERDYRAWDYDESKAPNPQEQGVVITYHPETMKVRIHEGLVKRKSTTSAPSSSTEKKPVPPYTKALLEQGHFIKTKALQSELSKHHRLCLIVNIMGLLGSGEVKLKTDLPRWKDFATPAIVQGSDEYVKAFKKLYGKDSVETYPLQVDFYNKDETKLFKYLQGLEDEKLQTLFNLLTATLMGSWFAYDPQPGNAKLAVALAKCLELDMQKHFTLNDEFLKGYRKTGLAQMLNELGFTQDYSGLGATELRAFILKETKDKQYLPKLVQFFAATLSTDDGDDDEDDEALDAA